MKKTGAEILLKCIEEKGIEQVYGVLGREAEILGFGNASNLNIFITHHENTAGMMACSIARCTNSPQVCFVTLGPGLTHIMTSVAMACVDRNPVLFIAAQVESADLNYNNIHQCIDGIDITKSLVKYSKEITNYDEIGNVMEEAFQRMMVPPFGPAVISVPIDILKATENTLQDTTPDYEEIRVKSESEYEELMNEVYNANNPVIVIGDYAYKGKEKIEEVIVNLIDKHNIPCATTYSSAGIIPYDNKNHIGMLNTYEKHFTGVNIRKEFFKDADMIILLGYDSVEHHPRMWDYGEEKVLVTNIPYDTKVKYKNIKKCYKVNTEIKEFVKRLDCYLNNRVFNYDNNMVSKIKNARDEFCKTHTIGNLSISEICNSVYKKIGNDVCIVTDIGLNRHLSAVGARANKVNSFITSAGLSAFGVGLPMAIGAKIAHPEKDIVMIAGDGGVLSVAGDLETLRRKKIKILVVVYNSSAYSLIKRYSKNSSFVESNDMETDFGNTDFVQLAKSMGCKAYHAEDLFSFEKGLETYQAGNDAMLIEVSAFYPDLYIKRS